MHLLKTPLTQLGLSDPDKLETKELEIVAEFAARLVETASRVWYTKKMPYEEEETRMYHERLPSGSPILAINHMYFVRKDVVNKFRALAYDWIGSSSTIVEDYDSDAEDELGPTFNPGDTVLVHGLEFELRYNRKVGRVERVYDPDAER